MTNPLFYTVLAVIIFGAVLASNFYGTSQLTPPQPSPTKTVVIDPLEGPEEVDDNLTKTLQLETFTPSGTIPTPSCTAGSKIAVDLLLDNSGSMKVNQKMDKLKRAVNNFVKNLSDNDVIGVQKFLGRGKTSAVIPLKHYSDHKTIFESEINKLNAEGGTPMKTGFLLAKQKIDQAKSSFPNYYWVLIVLGDGGPNKDQNPLTVASQIKASGVRIISIGLELNAPNRKATPQEARAILKGVASDPKTDFYEPSADQLEEIWQQIATSICR